MTINYFKLFTFTCILFFQLSLSSIHADDKKDIESFLDLYFKSWSSGDMETYSSLFHKEAVIQFLDSSQKIISQNAKPFLDSQKVAVASEKMEEVPLSKKFEVSGNGNTVHAIVRWKLRARKTDTFGYDHYVLIRSNGSWKITYLLYYIE